MKKNEIMNSLTRKLNITGLKIKKHSPEILIVAGIIGTVTSAVMACKATTKLNDVLEETKDEIEKIEGYVEENGYSDKYSEEDKKKDLAIVKTQGVVKVIKLYAPSVVLGTLSLTAIVSSNRILKKRNIAIAAAYATVDKSFKDYRSRVVERFGKELDRELRHNIKVKEVEEVVTDENGNEKVEKKNVSVVGVPEYSDYAKIYDDGNTGWCKDPEASLMFLRRQQDYANDKLKEKGYLFLNEVYEMLGFQRTKAGQMVGWIYDEKNPNGDNYVDFGIYDVNKPKNAEFLDGKERAIILDFNVDGVILDMI